MSLVYSPIDGSELDGAILPRPRSAFMMIHANDRVSAIEARMQGIVREEIDAAKYNAVAATDIARTDDYLGKIISMIQGCGFGVAIFSDATPARTLANIFFEVGYCLALGKPTQLIVAGDNAAPSDFVRSEWISYKGDEKDFRERLRSFLQSMSEHGEFFHHLAQMAEHVEEPDLGVAYERYKRAFLISGHERDIDGIRRLLNRLRGISEAAAIGNLMRANRRNLSDTMNGFLRLAEIP